MITIFTALYPEAKGLITKLKLKKNPEETLYQLFEGEDIHLVITGAGAIAAATAAARQFAKYPVASGNDIVINLGLSGYAPSGKNSAVIGDLFQVSKITETATKRTFYPDLLYQRPFRLMPLHTVPLICNDATDFCEETLIDMEASALYQALLPHFSPDRMLFFKIISDIPGIDLQDNIQPEALLLPHLDSIISYMEQLQQLLEKNTVLPPALSAEEAVLAEKITCCLPMTEAMHREYKRLLSYAKLSGIPLTGLLQSFLTSLDGETIRGKKQAMPFLLQLRSLIMTENSQAFFSSEASMQNTTNALETETPATLYQPFFATVYVEKKVWQDTWKQKFSEPPVLIDHYKDVFNRSHQNFLAQKKAPALILAKKSGTLIYKGAPVCQSFGEEYFYYTSCMMNCIYHCDYCYLQGMYPSGHVVVFVNLEDYFAELRHLLQKHPVYLCISYDTDLLALENKFAFVSQWLSFASEQTALRLEIRTKSGNPEIFPALTRLFAGNDAARKRIIFAWTVSPEVLCRSTEHGAASLALRIKALLAAKKAGFSVRLCFDPMIFHKGWKETYAALVDYIFSILSADDLYDVSIGVFRISTEYLKIMRKKRPDSAIVQYPYQTEQGVSHYGTLSEEMVQYLKTLLLEYLPEEKIFLWDGGN